MEDIVIAGGDGNTPLPNRDLFALALKQTAENSYLEHHPHPARSVRRAMRHKLSTVYKFIAESTTEQVWREEYEGNYEAQMRTGVITGAMACDIARGISQFSSQSVFRSTMEEYYGEFTDA